MTIELITKFLEVESIPHSKPVKIDFKKRNSIYGVFVKGVDYAHLKSKNFWRIVSTTNIDEWNRSKNIELAKIFNGSEITKLSLADKKVVA